MEQTTTTNKIEVGQRFNAGKPQWNLVDLPSFEPMVRVLEYGAKKYAPHNWKKGLPITEIYDSLQRHLIAFMGGEDNDPESGLPHIGHIQCNIMFMAYMFKNKAQQFDDRHKEPSFEGYKIWANEVLRQNTENLKVNVKD